MIISPLFPSHPPSPHCPSSLVVTIPVRHIQIKASLTEPVIRCRGLVVIFTAPPQVRPVRLGAESPVRLKHREDQQWQDQTQHHLSSPGYLGGEELLQVGLSNTQPLQVVIQQGEVHGQVGRDVGDGQEGQDYLLLAEGADTRTT